MPGSAHSGVPEPTGAGAGVAVGLTGEVRLVVSDQDTAIAAGSGDVPVLATPRLLALAEEATVAAVREHLPEGHTTVGTTVALSHRVASAVGTEVMARAELTEVDGRRLVFTVEARQDDTLVGTGRVERVVVDRQRFLSRLG